MLENERVMAGVQLLQGMRYVEFDSLIVDLLSLPGIIYEPHEAFI